MFTQPILIREELAVNSAQFNKHLLSVYSNPNMKLSTEGINVSCRLSGQGKYHEYT